MKRLIEEMPFVHKPKFVEGEYCPEDFFKMAKGLENVPEGGERCFKCFRSPLKNAQKINEIGEELAEIYDVKHLPSDFKKKNGYKRSTELSKEYQLYRQDYCGCVFSKKEREEQKKKSCI